MVCLFSWDKIPGSDNGKLIDFLIQKFGVDWVKTAKIKKIDHGKIIKVYTEKNSLSLRLNDKKFRVKLEIDDGRKDDFIAKTENDKLNIYTKVEKQVQDIPIEVSISCPSMGDFEIKTKSFSFKSELPSMGGITFKSGINSEALEVLTGKVWKSLIHPPVWFNEKLEHRRHKKLIQKYFAMEKNLSLMPGAEHPEHPMAVHPDNREAAQAIMSLIDKEKLKAQSQLIFDTKPTKGHRYSFGSPTSTEEIKQIMGILVGNKIVTPFGDDPPIEFKYVFGERSNKKATRYVGGNLVPNRQLTTIFEAETKKKIYEPDINSNGWLKTDIILITRFPNLLTISSYQKGLQYVNMAGITGVGTKAAALCMSDKKFLDRLAARVKDPSCFQALVEITEIYHDDENKESIPVDFEFLDNPCAIEIDDERIQQWLKNHKIQS